jgi:ankyrin repeat protein
MSLPCVHAVDAKGYTALHHAAETGNKQLLLQLRDAGAYIDACTYLGNLPLHLAAGGGHHHLIPYLIAPTTLDRKNSYGLTPLQQALMYKHWDAANVLVAAGAAPYGLGSALSFSSLVRPGDEALDTGLVFKAWLADRGPTGLVAQALHALASRGYVQAVENLVNAGADPAALDARSPLQLAAAAGHAQLVPLLATPATINPTWPCRCTPLSEAAAGGHVETVAALLAAGAHVNTTADEYHSPLAKAAERGHMLVVEVLLRALAKEDLLRQRNHQQQQQQQQQQAAPHGRGGMQSAQASAATERDDTWQHSVVHLVAAALAHAMKGLGDAPPCAQLLELVLDVLGPEVTKQVCQHMVQRQYGYQSGTLTPRWMAFAQGGRQLEHLAEALLLGCLGAEERQLLPSRLQRLLPGVAGPQQQQQQQKQQRGLGPQQLVQKAVTAAVYGKLESARDKLRQCAQLNLQQGGMGAARALAPAPNTFLTKPSSAVTGGRPLQQQTGSSQGVTPLVQLVQEGLQAAASRHSGMVNGLTTEVAPPGSAMEKAELATAAEVHDTLLSAWVAARRGGSRELVGSVVAAVQAAQRQHHQE